MNIAGGALLAPLFLIGLLAFALPWLLHRLQEQQAPVRDFPSKRFLQPAQRVTTRRQRLRYLRLLLLRALALGALCVLFAQPVLHLLGAGGSSAPRERWVVVDTSLSMQHGERWQRAMDIAGGLSAGFGAVGSTDASASGLRLFSASQSLEAAGTEADGRIAASAWETQLGSLRADHGDLRLATVMQQVDRLAERAGAAVEVHFVSDMQESNLPANLNQLAATAVQELVLHPVASSADTNAALDASIQWNADDTLSVHLQARLYGLPVEAVETSTTPPNSVSREVILSQGGRVLARQSLQLSPNAPISAVFDDVQPRLVNTSPGQPVRLLVAFAEPDALPVDDSVQLAVPDRSPLMVYLQGASTVEELASSREQVFLATALSQGRRARLQPLEQSRGVPADADMLITLLPADQQQLAPATQRFLANGGGVFAIVTSPLRDGARPTLQTRTASAANSSSGAIEAGVDTSSDAADARADALVDLSIGQIEAAHPLGLDVAGWSDINLYQAPYNAELTGAVLVRDSQDRPLLVEVAQPQGRLLLLTMPLDGVHNDLPLHPVFVPFMQAVADFFLLSNSYPDAVTFGDTIVLRSSAQLFSPTGDALLGLGNRDGREPRVLSEIGVYTVIDHTGEYQIRSMPAVAESDIRAASETTLTAWQQKITQPDATDKVAADAAGDLVNASATSAADAASSDTRPPSDDSTRALPLWRWLLPLFVVLALLELFVANLHLNVQRSRA